MTPSIKLISKFHFTIFSLMLVLIFCGCNLAGDIQKTANMAKCEYNYNSISNVSIGGINVSNGVSTSDAAKILLLLGGQRMIPLNFTMTLDVKNPEEEEAAFWAMLYKVKVDDMDFTEGSVSEPFSVAPGETNQLPIKINIDVAELMHKYSTDAIINTTKNFIGIGSGKTKIHVDLTPKFNVAGQTVTSPKSFPVDFFYPEK